MAFPPQNDLREILLRILLIFNFIQIDFVNKTASKVCQPFNLTKSICIKLTWDVSLITIHTVECILSGD
jgi:hypothetical protein